MCHSSSPVPCCTLGGYNKKKRGAKNICFSFKPNANCPFSDLFSLLCPPASTTSRTLPWNVQWEVPRVGILCQAGSSFCPARGHGAFLGTCSELWGRDKTPDFQGKSWVPAEVWKQLNLCNSHPSSGAIHRAGKTPGLLGSQR